MPNAPNATRVRATNLSKDSEGLASGQTERYAYFTMEAGISHKIPTYAGGLGILAGDTLKSYADLHVPAVGVTLLNLKSRLNDFWGNHRT